MFVILFNTIKAEQYGNQQWADMIQYKLDPRYNRPTKSAASRVASRRVKSTRSVFKFL